MEMITAQVKNPWVMAALVGGGAYFGLNYFKPGMVYNSDGSFKNPMVNPMTVGAGAAAAVLGYHKFIGKSSLPLPGTRQAVLEQAMERASALLPPAQFKV